MSSAPRPHTQPSRSSPDHGSRCHSPGSASTVSTWPRKPSAGPSERPRRRATRLGRPGSAPAARTRSRRPGASLQEFLGGLLVTGRIHRVEADQPLEQLGRVPPEVGHALDATQHSADAARPPRPRGAQALRGDGGAGGRRPRGRRGRARRAAGPQRRRQVHPDEDRLRAGPPHGRARRGVRRPGRVAGGARARSATWRSCSAFRAGQRRRAAALHQRLAGSAGGAGERAELLELVGPGGRARPPRSRRCRRACSSGSGSPRRWSARRACCCSTSPRAPSTRRAADRPRAAGGAARRGVAVLLNSHLLSEVELVCDRVAIIDRGRVVAEGTPAELARPGGVEVETAAGSGLRGRRARGRAADRRELVAAGERSTGCAVAQHARGRLPRGGGGGDRMSRRRARSSSATRCARACGGGSSSSSLVLTRRLPRPLRRSAPTSRFATSRGFAGRPAASSTRTAFTGATIFGLAMFATLFLGAVLAVFLTLGVVRGDAERGLLQPLVVRPLGRATLLSAASPAPRRSAPPTCWSSTRRPGDHRRRRRLVARPPDRRRRWAWPPAVVMIAALSLLGSVFLRRPPGIAVFMVFGAGLTAGLLGQIGHALLGHAADRSGAWRPGRSPSRRSTSRR